MTTLAYRDGVLAVDSLCCNSGGRRGLIEKAVAHGGTIYAGCGMAQTVVEFFEWAAANEPKDYKFTHKAEDFAGLIVRFVDGRPQVWTIEEALKPWEVRMPFTARGSGVDYALGAMAMGASAAKAVQVAATFDLGTGGPVRVWKRNESGIIEAETLADL